MLICSELGTWGSFKQETWTKTQKGGYRTLQKASQQENKEGVTGWESGKEGWQVCKSKGGTG
eukprot:1158705-Pelagomonas_calceolata.AAC.2